MKQNLVNRYFLDGEEHHGDFYIRADRTSKSGYACYASPNFTDKLEIRECVYRYKLSSVCITQEPIGEPPELIMQGVKPKLLKEYEQKVNPINIMYMVCPIVILVKMLF